VAGTSSEKCYLHDIIVRRHDMCGSLCIWLHGIARTAEVLTKAEDTQGSRHNACTSQVFKFERLQPLSYYATADQPAPKPALPWGPRVGKDEALANRCRMVRCESGTFS